MERIKPVPAIVDIPLQDPPSYERVRKGILEWRVLSDGKTHLGFEREPFTRKEYFHSVAPQSLMDLEPCMLQQVADLWDKAGTREEVALNCLRFCERVCVLLEPKEFFPPALEGEPMKPAFVSIGTFPELFDLSSTFGVFLANWKKWKEEGDLQAWGIAKALVSALLQIYPTRVALDPKDGKATLEHWSDAPAAWLALWSADLLAGNNALHRCAKCGGWGTNAVMTHVLKLEGPGKETLRKAAKLPLIGEIWLHNKSDSKAGKGKVQEDCYGIIMKRVYRAKQNKAPNNQPVAGEK